MKLRFDFYALDTALLSKYYEKPCRFKLRSGKEVFGVVWKEVRGGNTKHYFSSSENFKKIIHGEASSDELKTMVEAEDFIAAEMLQGIIPGKDMFK